MKISWFPGHMNKTRKALAKLLHETDILLEVLDARIPDSSQNPLFAEWQDKTTTVKLINKIDMADNTVTQQWVREFETRAEPYMLIQANQPAMREALIRKIRDVAPKNRGTVANPTRVLVIGLPNVGKSTLLNHLLKRKLCQVGDTPAVTRNIKRIKLETGIVIYDTPGVMWTNPSSENCGYRLALCAAIADTAFEYPDLAVFAVEYLSAHYPEALMLRYKIAKIAEDPVETMESIGRAQHLVSGKSVDWEKTARRIIQDFRSGALGQISLETPSQIEKERTLGV